MSEHWKVARIENGDVPQDHYAEFAAWLASFDIDATDCLAAVLITQRDDCYYLHVTRMVRVDGKPVLDHVTGSIQSTPTMVALGTDAPNFPWLTAAFKRQIATKHDSPVFRKDYDTGVVTVLTAPRRTRVTLNFVQLADPDALRINGADLHLGAMPDGQDVVYRVTGWDDDDNVLTLWRSQPEDDPPPMPDETVPAEPGDGLKKLAAVNAEVEAKQ